jgi:hypothetical protein
MHVSLACFVLSQELKKKRKRTSSSSESKEIDRAGVPSAAAHWYTQWRNSRQNVEGASLLVMNLIYLDPSICPKKRYNAKFGQNQTIVNSIKFIKSSINIYDL